MAARYIRSLERVVTRLIYLLLFVAPQALLYLYLRSRLPDPSRPRWARAVRIALAVVFATFNARWVLVAQRALFGSMWSIGRLPLTAPWIAWQLLGWIFCALVAVYLLGTGVWWLAGRVRGARYAVPADAHRDPAANREQPRTADRAPALSRRRFLARATYAYAGAGVALSSYGISSAYRLPQLTRRTLRFPDLPAGLDGLTLLHLSDLHAGVHLGEDKMQAIVQQANALRPDLIVQTGDMIDISPSYIPAYVRAFRDLRAPLGVVAVR